MKIDKITQAPFGTIGSLDTNIPSGTVGSFITADGKTLHKVIGTSAEKWTEILVSKTEDLLEGKNIQIMKIA